MGARSVTIWERKGKRSGGMPSGEAPHHHVHWVRGWCRAGCRRVKAKCRGVKEVAGTETQPPLGDIAVSLTPLQSSESGKGKGKVPGVMASGEAGIRVRLNMSEVPEAVVRGGPSVRGNCGKREKGGRNGKQGSPVPWS
jgi:hypothetical protein